MMIVVMAVLVLIIKRVRTFLLNYPLSLLLLLLPLCAPEQQKITQLLTP